MPGTIYNGKHMWGLWVVTGVDPPLEGCIRKDDVLLIPPERSHPVLNVTAVEMGEGRPHPIADGPIYSYGINNVEYWLEYNMVTLQRPKEAFQIDEDA